MRKLIIDDNNYDDNCYADDGDGDVALMIILMRLMRLMMMTKLIRLMAIIME